MRPALFALAFLPAGLLVAQQSAKQYTLHTYDVNGRRVEGAGWVDTKTPTLQQSNRSMRNINGRTVPSQSVQERVVFQSASERIVERTVQLYDYEGRPLPAEKIRIEARKNRDGSESVVTNAYRQDVHGRLELYERRATQAVKSAAGESSSTVVERESPAGRFEVVERIRAVETRGEGRTQRDTVTQRKDVNGRFYDAAREISDKSKQPGLTTQTKTIYEAGSSGSLLPANQTVSRTRTLADRSEVEEVSIHTPWAAGKTSGGAPQMQLSEQWLVERKPGPGNVVIESSSISKPTIDHPPRMSAYQKISETVCSGACKSEE